ncbi:MAG: hypothetical protein FD165_797 [Gammaproteobacteria bacterium]|nr:MAG: hypothetical protein FD165_797 [Gammaproteobacteria bacterium]TND07124.1 MAG: hypothetical protein FD120_292 [Gammaproteobacteria bacterium]
MSLIAKHSGCALLMLALAACNSGNDSAATDGFIEYVKSVVAVSADEAEPAGVDQVMVTSPEYAEPVAIDTL